MSDDLTHRRRAVAVNALGSALKTSGHWLPFSVRQDLVDAVLAAVDSQAADDCTCAAAGPAFAPAGHYSDCPRRTQS